MSLINSLIFSSTQINKYRQATIHSRSWLTGLTNNLLMILDANHKMELVLSFLLQNLISVFMEGSQDEMNKYRRRERPLVKFFFSEVF